MRTWKLLLALSILALIVATLGGCLFGGGADEEAEGGEMPEGEMPSGPDAPGPPGPGGDMPGPPAGDMGPPLGDTAPPPDMPGAAPGPGPGPAPAGGGGSTAKALQFKHEGNYDAAAAEYRNVIAGDPDNADAHWGLAWILAEQGKTDEAKGEFEAFLGLSDDQAKMKEAEAALQRL